SHPEPGMPAQLVVGARPAPVLHEEQPQVLLGRAEVLGRVDRTQHGVFRHALVEPVDQAGEKLLPAHRLVEADRLAHACQLTGCQTPSRLAGGMPSARPPVAYDPRAAFARCRTHWIRGFTAPERTGSWISLRPARVRTHWIRGFIAFQTARRTRSVMLVVPVGLE